MPKSYYLVVGDDSGLNVFACKKSFIHFYDEVILYKSYSKNIACEWAIELLKEDKRNLIKNMNLIKRYSRKKINR